MVTLIIHGIAMETKSNGKIEQRGIVITCASSLKFPISMSKTDYIIKATQRSNSGNTGKNFQYYNPLTTGCSLYMAWSNGGAYGYWEASTGAPILWELTGE